MIFSYTHRQENQHWSVLKQTPHLCLMCCEEMHGASTRRDKLLSSLKFLPAPLQAAVENQPFTGCRYCTSGW